MMIDGVKNANCSKVPWMADGVESVKRSMVPWMADEVESVIRSMVQLMAQAEVAQAQVGHLADAVCFPVVDLQEGLKLAVSGEMNLMA